MPTDNLKVSFLKRASVELADNEKVSLWEPARSGTIRVSDGTIQLEGKWRVSVIGNFLGGGVLGELLIKPFFLKERSETVSLQNLDRALIHQRKKTITFHLFQTRDHGMVEVHVFVADKNVTPQVTEALKAIVPANLLQEQNVG